ncbi:YceI family protein [Aequorivita marina]|uniref:YceI family protein n=1 Tax=Aequorivita marina TaxID=3073654 RepID=UPI002873F7BF|nr:YceI family protein [Aequorivita sp. S2608]MDS1298138.1 YceI family protein [Aequorivita sp. S2608]
MKKILAIILFVSTISFGQNKFITRTGELSFEASVPSFEEVAAKNSSVTVIINAENGEIAALALVKAFRFKNALMEEHFNENYAESSKYPKATFKGKLVGFTFEELNGTNNLVIEGTLEFHGVTKQFTKIPINLVSQKNKITISGNFRVRPSDFNIKIPKIVQSKVSDTVQIAFNFELLKK